MTTDPTEDLVEAALRAAAPDDTRVEAGLADLRARLDDQLLAAPPASTSEGWSRRRLALVAAVVLLAVSVSVSVAVVARRGGDDRQPVVTAPDVPSTGWYLPEGLSADWELEDVSTDFRDAVGDGAECPCRTWLWSDASAEETAFVLRSAAGGDRAGSTDPGASTEEVDLGDGVSGSFVVDTLGPYLTFEAGGHQWTVAGVQLPKDETLAMGRQIVGGSGEPQPPRDTFELLEAYATPGGIRSYQDVHVILRNRISGSRVAYVLAPSGRGPSLLFLRAVPERVDLGGATGLLVDDPAGTTYVFRRPDADVSSDGDAMFGADPGPATDADRRRLLASLQPATASEWAGFVRSASGEGATDAIAPTIDDLSEP